MTKRKVYRVDDGMNRDDVLCTTYQMRNFYAQFRDGFFSNLDVMNLIQHYKVATLCKPGMEVLDVCCGRSLMLPLLRYYAKNIKSYTGVDIEEKNIKEAMRGASKSCGVKGGLTDEELKTYYPFNVGWVLCDVAKMSEVVPAESKDLVIYTSSIEHMHPDNGRQSLVECYKVMRHGAKMFLSCPNTPGNGYNTQYRAHVYEWGYDELKTVLHETGFIITDEVGLIMKGHKMDDVYQNAGQEVKGLYDRLRGYIPTVFLSAVMAAPYPKQSDEVLFIVKKR